MKPLRGWGIKCAAMVFSYWILSWISIFNQIRTPLFLPILPLFSVPLSPSNHQMAKDGALRSAIVWLSVIMVLVGVFTFSLKKIMVTYAFGMLGISGILLPDWDFFDRDFSRWPYPVTADERAALQARRSGFKRLLIFFFISFSHLPLHFIYNIGSGRLLNSLHICEFSTRN